ncbi:hypothetical protein MD484_g3258, partial [Candolleomyces efflorescens]
MYENGATVELISDYGLSHNGVAQGTKGVVVKQIKSSTLEGWIYTINIGKGNNIRYVGPIPEELLAPFETEE